jgi:PAS domain S-box-containing protein
MPLFRDMPIKQKLMAIIMSVATAALLLSGLGIVVADSIIFRASMQRDISALAQIVADNSAAALAFNDPRTATETLASLKARPHLVAACIYRPDGAIFAKYVRAGAVAGCPSGNAQGKEEDELRFTGTGLIIRRPIALNQARIGTLVMVNDLGQISERIRLYGQAVLLVLLLSSLIAFLLSSRLRAIVAEPISQLASATRSVSETRDYSIRAQKLSGDELGALADGFNDMLARIQSQDCELRKALLAQEAALRESQEVRDSLRTTLASIGDAVISTDARGRVVFVNPIAQSLLGLQEADIVDKHLDEVFQIVNEFSRTKVASPVTEVLRECGIVGMANHTILIAKDGTEIPIDDSGAPIRDQSGAIQGTVLVFRDVTARRRADETSRLLASIVQSTDDAIFSKDLNGIVTSWNRGAERTFGFSAKEIIGRSISAIFPPDQTDDLSNIMNRIGQGERIEHYQTVRQTRTGELLNVSITISPMQDPLGRITGASVISRNITEQVRAADRLARLNTDLQLSNEVLALTNQDLERFAFIASHDLQEPLRMITAYSQLLIKSYPGQFDSEASIFVGNIVDGTTRMRDLLADLLVYTEIRSRDEQPLEVVDLNVVVENVRQNLKASMDESGAVVTSDRLPVLRAYAAHFQPLFQNLIGNAIKYRSAQPPRVHVSVQEADGELRFSVSDNGMGIDPEYHKRIFEVFRRLHGRKIPGSGVGLAICQRVVERYGGRIWVESQAGQGATFLFTAPQCRNPFRGGELNG